MERLHASRLLEVTVEKSLDLLEKRWDESIFIKLYVSIRTSGLLAKLSDTDLRTLIALATFMNSEGNCYPSQETLARALGISQPAVAKRMKRLLAFRWQGKALVTARKVRNSNGRYETTVYTVLPATKLDIFSKKKRDYNHITDGHMAEGHTNKNQELNKIKTTVTGSKLTEGEEREANLLALDMGDTRSLAYYRKVIRQVPPPIFFRARSEALAEDNIRRSRGALFAHLVKKYHGQLGNPFERWPMAPLQQPDTVGRGPERDPHKVRCPDCNGTAKTESGERCQRCQGRGWILTQK